jgi:hypothetical protein
MIRVCLLVLTSVYIMLSAITRFFLNIGNILLSKIVPDTRNEGLYSDHVPSRPAKPAQRLHGAPSAPINEETAA